MEQLLQDLQQAGVELHAMSNYPVWYKHVNKKLGLDRCALLGSLAEHSHASYQG